MNQDAEWPTVKETIEDEIQTKKDFLDLLEEKRARDRFSPHFDAELECTCAVQRELQELEQKLEALNAAYQVHLRPLLD